MSISAKKLLIMFFLVAIIVVLYDLQKGSYEGPLFIEDPIQSDVGNLANIELFQNKKIYTIRPLATYEIRAVVKHIEKYTTDATADISPVDFALAWGSLANPEIDRHIRYSQGGRWYHWQVDGELDLTLDYISEHSSNVHIIPANKEIEKMIMKTNKEDYIHLKGYLVAVILQGGTWTSSLSRIDTGDGACEIFYVKEILKHNE